MKIELHTVHSGYDRKTCWVHARPGFIPGKPGTGIITTQKLRLTGDDVFYEINSLRSLDGGRTWSEPAPQSTLARRVVEDGIEEGVCDFWPTWHAASGTLLATGHTVRYINDEQQKPPRPRHTAYSTYDVEQNIWAEWKKLEIPGNPYPLGEGAGCTQRLDLTDGTILLPIYFNKSIVPGQIFQSHYAVTVLRCSFDGETLQYLDSGDELTVPVLRGLVEPSLAYAAGRYFLTLRNDEAAYISTSEDGLHYTEPRKWTFDDGSDLGNYNTQQHWLAHGDDLYLIYTRRGANNDHIVRHRAPLFIAQIDKERLCVLRESEQILIPQRGARLGNFGVAQVSDSESWVVDTEWMQGSAANPFDPTYCEKWGSDNSIFLAKVTF